MEFLLLRFSESERMRLRLDVDIFDMLYHLSHNIASFFIIFEIEYLKNDDIMLSCCDILLWHR